MRKAAHSRCTVVVAFSALIAWPVLCCPFLAFSQTTAATAAVAPPVSYESEAQVVEKSVTLFHYNSDGTGFKEMFQSVKVQSEAGARLFSVLSIPYASANQSPLVLSLVVHHPDGTSTETPASDAMDMPALVTQQAPLYSDLKVLQIPVRGLRAGDTIKYRIRIQQKNPEAPSQFWDNFSFPKGVVVLAESLTLDVPSDKYVQVWSPAFKPVVSVSDGRRISVWTTSQLKSTAAGQGKSDSTSEVHPDNKPDVAWTTFHSWQEVGEWYRSLAAPRAIPTDALRARAGELTQDAKTPEDKVRALYSFVSTHIRFVGVDFGVGRFQPHFATVVLANQYGDCKDKDTLLEALLHATGFTTAPALIGVNIEMVKEVPSPAFFNHLITTVNLPSGRIWLDSTPGVSPFQFLLSPIRDKDALVIPPEGVPALEKTPTLPPYPFVDQFEADATLQTDGGLTGHVDISYRSDSEVMLRLIAENLAPAQWDQGSQYVVNLLGFSGTTSNTIFTRADDTSQPMHLKYDYSRKPFGDWDNFRIIPLAPVIALPAVPDKQPAAEIDLGALRTEGVNSRIHLPAGFSADLPDAVHVQMPFATFEKSYKLEDGELIFQRKLVILQSKLSATSWQQYAKFTKDISLGEESWIQLTSSSSAGSGKHPPKPGENNPEAAKLVTDATVLERNRDWTGAKEKLDEAKAIQPKQPYLWSNFGFLAMVQNDPDEAKGHFRYELSLHPDEAYVVRLYGRFLYQRREYDEARKVLSAYFQSDASDSEVATLLAAIQARLSLPDAIATLKRACAAAPTNHDLQSALGEDLFANHENAEAAALADKMLADAGDDSGVQNDAAYLLAEMNTELPHAEQESRKALQMLDSETATAAISEANEDAFRRCSLLVASWDTLGFILLKENKLVEARGYLEAAWKNSPAAVIAVHYGQVEEALGNPREALRIYQLSRPVRADDASPVLQQLNDSIARLQHAGVLASPNEPGEGSLQEQRTFTLMLRSASKTYRSATYRLLVGATGIQAVMRVNGEPIQEGAEEAIRKLALPHLVPMHSSAKLLRDAVLSCSPGKTECFFVLMPMGGMSAERAGN